MNTFKYNIGYALSGGFIKGFAHLGIMQAPYSMLMAENPITSLNSLNTIHLPNSQPFPLTNKDC